VGLLSWSWNSSDVHSQTLLWQWSIQTTSVVSFDLIWDKSSVPGNEPSVACRSSWLDLHYLPRFHSEESTTLVNLYTILNLLHEWRQNENAVRWNRNPFRPETPRYARPTRELRRTMRHSNMQPIVNWDQNHRQTDQWIMVLCTSLAPSRDCSHARSVSQRTGPASYWLHSFPQRLLWRALALAQRATSPAEVVILMYLHQRRTIISEHFYRHLALFGPTAILREH
jgi:hypothetical protein